MVAEVAVPTEEVAIGKVALVCPAGTVTVAATDAAALLLAKEIVLPFTGAGPLSVTAPVLAVPPFTDAGAMLRATTDGRLIVSVAALLTP